VIPTPAGRTVVARVSNRGQQHQASTLVAHVDGHVVDAKPVDLAGGATADFVFGLPANAARVELRLDSHDALALDDVAYAVARSPRTYRVLLVTQRNLFLQSALGLRSDLVVTVETPANYHPDASYDLAIFDGYVPPRLPDQPAWYLAPPADGRLGAGDLVNVGRVQPAVTQDPLIADVDLSTVHIARSRVLSESSFGRPLITSDQGPLVLVKDSTPRAVLFGFDLHETDLGLQAAFPILVDHLTAFLMPEAVPQRSHEPGDLVDLTAPSASTLVTVTRPDGSRFSVVGGGVIGGADTQLTGFYAVDIAAGAQIMHSSFAVNALDPGRGSIAPRGPPNVAGAAQSSAPAGTSTLDLWPYFAAAALVLLSAEWLVWTRSR
jgi:Ca-activated chloride channel family protein